MKWRVLLFSLGLVETGCSNLAHKIDRVNDGHFTPIVVPTDPAVTQAKTVENVQKTYTLIDLVEAGLNQNPVAKEAWLSVQMIEAQKGRTESSLFPHIAVATTATRGQVGHRGQQPTTVDEGVGPSVILTYKLFQFGADRASADAARHILHAAQFQFNRQLQEIVFQIQECYYRYCALNAAVDARRANLSDTFVSREAIARRRNSGLASQRDYLRAQADYLRAQYECEAAQSQCERGRASLAQAVGLRVSSGFQVKTQFEVPTTTDDVQDVEVLIATTLAGHPGLKSARETIKSGNMRRLSEDRQALPKIVTTLDASTKRWNASKPWQRNYGAQIGIQWDLFDGFDREYRLLDAYARQKAAEASEHTQILKVVGATWAAFHEFRAATSLLDSARALEEASTEALEAIRVGYDSGVNSLLDLLSAQNQLADARLQHVQAKTNVALSIVTLAYATGQLPLTSEHL
jgi:outer membrane protein TolC